MILIKLKDSDMFGGSPNKYHLYLARKVRNKDEYRLNQLTHLYIKDPKRFSQVKRGLLKKVKVSGIDIPSGMKVEIMDKDFNGNKITYKSLINMKEPNSKYNKNVRIRYLK